MSEIQILTQFKQQLISFFDELVSQFPREPDLIILRIFFNDQIPIKDVMDQFNHTLIKVKKMIQERDEQFFLENNSVFETLSKDRVNHFKKLWRSGALNNEDKDVIWLWMDSFVYLANKYQKAIENN